MATEAKSNFVNKYLEKGEDQFYRFLISYAVNKLVAIGNGTYKGVPPDQELLEYYNQFIILYRREGDTVYLDLARLFRKAAHKIYRVMLKKDMTPRNGKFLNLV